MLKTNRKILALPIVVLVAGLASCSSGPLYRSQWQPSAVTVDGNASDWQRPLSYYDEDSKLNYTISNDSAKLYLCVEAFDLPTQTKIIRGGLQLWIDTAGSKDEHIGILYPVAATMEPAPREYDARGENPTADFDPIGRLRKNFLLSQGEIELSGFKSPIGGLVPLHNAFGIEVRIGWDTINNVLNYEAAIPFAAFYRPSLARADSLKTFGIKFTVNGVERHSTREPGEDEAGGGMSGGGYPGGTGGGMPGGMGGTGGMGGGGGMGRGGGHRGGGRGAGSANNPLAESSSFWIKLRLATPHQPS
ncbi:MAG TPA: hypothetical protein VG537_09750 [Candidatus Kapabacteria bacterium]|jgi:hypothetical protein|nr:hypothetical protein [Candidatus Kapabacteria bacterium]